METGKFNHGSPGISKLSPPTSLPFEVDAPLQKTIDSAVAKFQDVISKHDLQVVCFEAYGKNTIKKFGVSPDAFAQMAIQLAYYKMYGVCRATYESAQTKKFAFGRTETCRSVSNESVLWVKAMGNADLSAKAKGELGRKAIAAQSSYMANCVEGRGVDRHFLGILLCICGTFIHTLAKFGEHFRLAFAHQANREKT